MAKRKIRIRSGELEAWMEVTEEEYQKYYRPWWQQKKREQRNREAMEEKGYTEESYEAWREHWTDGMGIQDMDAESIEELQEKKMLLGILEEALGSLLPDERELAEKIFGEQVLVSEFAKEQGVPRTTVSSRKMTILEKLRVFFRERGIEVSGKRVFDKK